MLESMLFLAVLAAPVSPAQDDPARELKYYRAWHALEVDRKPVEAGDVFEALIRDPETGEGLKAKARLGLARSLRTVGKDLGARSVLRDVLQLHADLPDAVRQANDLLGATSSDSTRYITGISVLERGMSLDLDTGALFEEPRGIAGFSCEVRESDGAVLFLVDDAPTRLAIGAALEDLGGSAWRELETDQGRAAWVQTLASGEAAVVRWVTRLAGSGSVLPAVGRLFGVGVAGGVSLHFEPAPDFARYRIERRDGSGGSFSELGVAKRSPYIDETAKALVRYAYRVTGLTNDGHEGVPATTRATTESRGVRSGEIELRAKDTWADFILDEASSDGGDLQLRGTYGGADAAGFYDSRGSSVQADPALGAEWTVFDQMAAATDRKVRPSAEWQIPPDRWFTVPLRGGGVARCRWRSPEGRGYGVVLQYHAFLDGWDFPPSPRIVTKELAGGVSVKVADVDGWSVGELAATSHVGPGGDRRIPIGDRGAGIDRAAKTGSIVEYRAVAMDAAGRRGLEQRVSVNRMRAGVTVGEFWLHEREAFSLERGAAVPGSEADLVFSDSAGAVSGVELTAPSGIVTLRQILRRSGASALVPDVDGPGARARLFDGVASFDPAQIPWGSMADGDRRWPASDVSLLRTRSGAFAKLAIVERKSEGGRAVRLIFALNHKEPAFHAAHPAGTEISGVALDVVPLQVGRLRAFGAAAERLGRSKTEVSFCGSDDDGRSVQICAPEGIVSVRDLLRKEPKLTAEELYDAIVDCDPAEIDWLAVATGRVDCPSSDVFLVRAGDGVAKLLLVRDESGEGRVELRYAMNPTGSKFEITREQVDSRGGVSLFVRD